MYSRINNARTRITSLVTIVVSLLVIAGGTGITYNNQAQGQQLTFVQFQTDEFTDLSNQTVTPTAQTNTNSSTTGSLDGGANAATTAAQQQSNTSSLTIPLTTDFSTYSSQAFGFTIQYPSNWRVLPSMSPTQVVSFYSPFENLQDVIPVGVSISRSDYLTNVTLAGYTQRNLDILQRVGSNISQSSETTLSGMPAHMVISNNTLVDGTMNMVIWTVTNDGMNVYTIAYTATPQDFEQYRPIFDQMVSSFQITNEEGISGGSNNNENNANNNSNSTGL
jgi:hypothetical protein